MTTTDVFQGVGGKNSSRVLAAPGGKSSICFGAPDEAPSQPVAAPTANPVQGSPVSHAKPDDHDSHNMIFGDSDVQSTPDSQKVKKIAKGTGQYNPTTGDGQCSGYNPVTGEDYEKHDSDKVSPRQKYANDQTRGAYNPITGELYEDSPKDIDENKSKAEKARGDFNPITGEAYVPKKEVHTSTRVRQPPGGVSSKLW